MKLNPRLAADLAALSVALREGDPEADLERSLRALVAAVARAVPSCHAVLLQVPASGASLRLAVRMPTDTSPAVGSSLCLPLPAAEVGSAAPDVQRGAGVLTLYAARPGAFVDLAADLAWSLGLDPDVCVLDADLVGPGDDGPVTGLASMSTINQAIGVLIGQGRTPREAEQELQYRRRIDDTSLHQAAVDVLHSPVRTPPREE